ncbi:MAG: hypothetical protein WD600_11990, partial [Pseudohongiella sp.]
RLKDDEYSVAVLPLSVSKASPDDEPGAYVDANGNVRIVTDTGRVILAAPVLEDGEGFAGFLDRAGLALSAFDERGNMVIEEEMQVSVSRSSGQMAMQSQHRGFNIGRPDLLSVPASRGDAPGVVEFKVPGMGDLIAYSVLFENADGQLMQQDIVPVPADWPALRQLLSELPDVSQVNINERGVVSVAIGEISITGRMDYFVGTGSAEPGETRLIEAGDLTGNGVMDFVVEYPDGRRQRLYVYP